MAESHPSLNVLSGPLAGQRFVLEEVVDNVLIGSDPSCKVHLDAPGVSPIHARLWIDLHGATVYDTNSPRGVYVNDDRVVREAPVHNGDILWLGPPGEEGSVLIQCILPSAKRPPVGAEPPRPPAAPSEPSAEDAGATMAFGMPAFMPDEPEFEPVEPAGRAEPDEPEPTVVMRADAGGRGDDAMAELGDPTVAYPPEVAAAEEAVRDEPPPAAEGGGEETPAAEDVYEVVDEPTVALPPPLPGAPSRPSAEDAGFPEFEVEPTVAMAPERIPATPPPVEPDRFDVPLPHAAAAPAEFEDEVEETVVDAPAPTVVTPRGAAPPEAEDEDAATVMYHRSEEPAPPPAPAMPPPVPARPAAPAGASAAAPPPVPAAPPRAAATPPPVPRPTAEARPAGRPPSAPAAPAARLATPPRARAERPAAAPARPARPGGGGRGALIAAAAVVVAALAFGGYWYTRSPTGGASSATTVAPAGSTPATEATLAAAPPSPTADTLPPPTVAAAPVAAPSAPVTESVTIVRSPVPSPRVAAAAPPTLATAKPGAVKPPTPAPAAQRPTAAAPTPNPAPQTAATVANLMAQARAAADARNFDAAVTMYDEVLKLDPTNGGATAGRTAALAARNAPRRAFVSGRTVVQTEKAKADIAGFDSSDVSVRKSADFQGRLEFAMTPASVKPGDPYRLQVALVNEGKKAIKISGMTFTMTVNGQKSGNAIAPRVKEVGAGQRAVLEELPGVFPEASSWTAEVLVTANKGDSLKNQVSWK